MARIVDSIPIPVCKSGTAHFHKSFKVYATYGCCVSKKETHQNIIILGDKGYVNKYLSPDLEIEKNSADIYEKR